MIFLESFEHYGKFSELLPEKGTLSFSNIINMPEDDIKSQSSGIYIIVKNTVFTIYKLGEKQIFQVDNYAITLEESVRIYLNRTEKTIFRDNIMDKLGFRHVFRIYKGHEILMTYKYLLSDTLNKRPLTIHRRNSEGVEPQGGEELDFFLFSRNLLNNPERRKKWFAKFPGPVDKY